MVIVLLGIGALIGVGAREWAVRASVAADGESPMRDHLTLRRLLAAAAAAAVAARAPTHWVAPTFGAFAGIVVALGEIDIAEMRIPRRVVVVSSVAGAAALAVGSAASSRWPADIVAIAAGSALFLFFLVIHLIAPRGFGYGDVRMGGMCGLFLGWLGWRVALDGVLAASLLSGAVGAFLLLFGVVPRSSRIPFGPFLAAGALVAIGLS